MIDDLLHDDPPLDVYFLSTTTDSLTVQSSSEFEATTLIVLFPGSKSTVVSNVVPERVTTSPSTVTCVALAFTDHFTVTDLFLVSVQFTGDVIVKSIGAVHT